MDYMAELTAIANSHNGIIETKTATQHGISAPVLSAFCKKGEIVRVGRGRYALYDDMEDEFLMISLRCKKAVFSHATALYLNGVSDDMPFIQTITVPANCVIPKELYGKCNVFYIRPSWYELGLSTVEIDTGRTVPVYNLERTICDIIRDREELGMYFFDALELIGPCYCDLFTTMGYAEMMRMYRDFDEYMDVLQGAW